MQKRVNYPKGNAMVFPLELAQIPKEEETVDLKYLYPLETAELNQLVMNVCDQLEYDGSPMYDRYPDKVTKHNERPIYTYTFLYTIQGSGIVEDEKGIKHVCGKNHAALIFEPSKTKRYPEPGTKEKWRYCWIMFIVTKQTKKYCNQILEKAGIVFYMPPNSMAITSMVDLII